MSGARFCLSRVCSLLAVAVLAMSGCDRAEPVQTTARPVASESPTPQVAIPSDMARSAAVEPRTLEGSGVTAWAEKFPGRLIAGLDGSLYVPYKRATIERVQKALIDRGLYAGPANGVLDRPTMKSIYEFQEANFNLQRCGIPTPHTRDMLQQGSHTDLNS
jgi:putative peptidoglycan binding protein